MFLTRAVCPISCAEAHYAVLVRETLKKKQRAEVTYGSRSLANCGGVWKVVRVVNWKWYVLIG